MNMLSNVLDLNDKMTKMTVLLGSSAILVLIVKNNEKALTSNLSNSLLLLICVGSLYMAHQINEESENFYNEDLITDIDNSSISDLSNGTMSEHFQDNASSTDASSEAPTDEPSEAPTYAPSEAPTYAPSEAPTDAPSEAPTDAPSETQTDAPSEALSNASLVSGSDSASDNYASYNSTAELQKVPEQCFPKDIRDPSELLPKDKDSAWAKNVPAGQGELKNQNFLNAGHHLGVNTVGQSLRNANRQIRSEPPNPQVKVSPWLQSTIEPDINRRGIEINT